ncbi:MAG: glycogen-binding domain-containing protein [Armatimonadetes bacterium]|nr:glycogen-binding domain-containing protein [Armatimonadota bacterium]
MRRLLFSLLARNAKDVRLVGDFTDWEAKPIIMDRMKPRSRTFGAVVDLPPGTYQYKFIVDGKWVEDPKAESVANDFGTSNSVITVEP